MRPIALARTAATFALVTLAACSHDSLVDPVPTPLGGTWSLSISHLADAKVTCEVAGFTVTLATTADGVIGTADAAADAHAYCDVIGGEPPFSTPNYPAGALHGITSSANISLALDDAAWSFTGTRVGETITGVASYQSVDFGEQVQRTGTFVMRRVSR